MFVSTSDIVLSETEHEELQARVRSRTLAASDVRRAQVVLMLADQVPYVTIQVRLGCSPHFINQWRHRFLADRLDGLYARHQGRRPVADRSRLEARILRATARKPPDGSTHWTTRKLAKHLGLPHMTVARSWARAGLQPHRFERYMASDDPDFEAKAADVIGLYVNPVERHAKLPG